MSSKDEWYTPPIFIEAARDMMGGIDLDPASCAFASKTVKSLQYYSKEDDGLSKPWYGRVWLNPPFTGNTSRKIWTRKLVDEYRQGHIDQAILLVPIALDTQWFQILWAFPVCFPTGRVSFHQENAHHNNPNFGVCFVYLGPHEDRFIEIFSHFGIIAKAVDTEVFKRKVDSPQALMLAYS